MIEVQVGEQDIDSFQRIVYRGTKTQDPCACIQNEERAIRPANFNA
jgi:hypothetical protein